MEFTKKEEFLLLSLFEQDCKYSVIARQLHCSKWKVYKYLSDRDLIAKRNAFRKKAREE